MVNYSLDDYYDYVKNIRREIHSNPELAFNEIETVHLIVNELKSFKIKSKLISKGVIAEINVGAKKTVAFRADMDALALQEYNDVPYKSRNNGIMHACGHDGHVALLLGLAKYLSIEKPAVNVRFIFQPAEEGVGGAKAMVEEGVLEGVDEIYAIHLDPSIEEGKLVSNAGPIMAGVTEFDIIVTGKNAHAAQKGTGIDALKIGVEIYEKLMTHFKDFESTSLFHIGKMSGGTARNIVANSCVLNCTYRWFDETVKKEAFDFVRKTCNEVAKVEKGKADVSIKAEYIPVINNAEVYGELLYKYGIEETDRRFISDDFAFFAKAKKGLMIFLGTKNKNRNECTLHSANFDFDERVLLYGLNLYLNIVMEKENG